jgi:hypothetical protein
LHIHTAKWPDLKAGVKNWITDHRISVSTKITIFEARRWVATYGITFSGELLAGIDTVVINCEM